MEAAASTRAKDPVCGMDVDVRTAEFTATHDGTTYGFCCDGCHDLFVADPAKYLAQAAKGAHAVPAHHAAPANAYIAKSVFAHRGTPFQT